MKKTPHRIGIFVLIALVAGNMVGSGVFLLPATLSSIGTISIFSWMLTAFGSMMLALTFASLSHAVPKTGGPYAYCRDAFGDFSGFSIGLTHWVAILVCNAGIAVALISYLSDFFPILKVHPFYGFLTAAGIIWGLTFINIFGIHRAGFIQIAATILKIIPLIFVIVFGIWYITPEYLTHFNVSTESSLSAFGAACALTLWSFVGIESATIPADSAENASKNIGKATVFATLVISLLYILGTVTVMGLIPLAQLQTSAAPYADAAQLFGGYPARVLVDIGAIIACFGTLNGWVMIQPQIPMAAAQDHLFPKIFARRNEHGAPVASLMICGIIVTALLLLTLTDSFVKQFTAIIMLATLASLIPYFFSSLALIMLIIQKKVVGTYKELIKAMIIATLSATYAFFALAFASEKTQHYAFLLLMAAVPLYCLVKARVRFSSQTAVEG